MSWKIFNLPDFKNIYLSSFIFFISFMFISCFYFSDPLRKAKKALKAGDCKKVKYFLSASSKTDKAFLLKSAEFCKKNSLKTAIWFYERLSVEETSIEKRTAVTEKLANLYFEKLKDYKKAVSIWMSLRNSFSSETQETLLRKYKYSYYIARCFFEMKNWSESLKEVEVFLRNPMALSSLNFKKIRLDFLFLKARILFLQEKLQESAVVFKQIKKLDYKFFIEQDIYMYLSMIYESQKNFHKAIKELKNFSDSSSFLKNRIERLKIRQKNLPADLLLNQPLESL